MENFSEEERRYYEECEKILDLMEKVETQKNEAVISFEGYEAMMNGLENILRNEQHNFEDKMGEGAKKINAVIEKRKAKIFHQKIVSSN